MPLPSLQSKPPATPPIARRPTRAARCWRRLRAAWAEGHWDFGYRVLRRLAERRPLRRWMHVSAVELLHVTTAEHKRFRRLPRTYEVWLAEQDDLDMLLSLFGSREQIVARLERGDRCLIATADGEACAGVWLAVGPTTYAEDADETGCAFRVPGGTVWSFDGRGVRMGAWGCLMAHLPLTLAMLGADEVYTAIDLGNHLSRDSHLSLGYRPIGRAACIRLGRCSWRRCSWRRCRSADGPWQRVPGQLAGLGVLPAER